MSSPRLNVESCRQPYSNSSNRQPASVLPSGLQAKIMLIFFTITASGTQTRNPPIPLGVRHHIYIYLIYLPLPFSRQEIVIQIPILVEMKIPRKK